MSELLPCPFCGGDPRRFAKGIECCNCGTTVQRIEGLQASIKHWNIRTPTPDATGKVLCPKCGGETRQDANSFECDRCQMCWPKGHGHEGDTTGKILLTKEQWEEAQRDTARLDWLNDELVSTIGHASPSGLNAGGDDDIGIYLTTRQDNRAGYQNVRQAIDEAMSADTKGTSA